MHSRSAPTQAETQEAEAAANGSGLSGGSVHERGDDKGRRELPILDVNGRDRSIGRTLLVRGLCLLAVAAIVPIDASIREPAERLYEMMGGDLKREFKAYSQFGGLTSVVLVGLVILLLDRARSSRLWDLSLSMGLASFVTMVFKILIGRTRPRFHTPEHFLGFWDSMPTSLDTEPIYSWQLWAHSPNEFWSMPSGHTSAAFALATFLAITYPRIRWLVFAVAIVVPMSRLMTGAHWASDVVAGGCVGVWVSSAVTGRGLGRRLAGRLGLMRTGGSSGAGQPAGG